MAAIDLPRCRSCGAELRRTFVDLGRSPLANSFLSADAVKQMEPFYPLHVFICENCLLVQLDVYQSADQIFDHYLYFSSYSEMWLRHCRQYAAQMVDRCRLDRNSLVIEVASNDGYLLQYFKERDIGVLGIEPARTSPRSRSARGSRPKSPILVRRSRGGSRASTAPPI